MTLLRQIMLVHLYHVVNNVTIMQLKGTGFTIQICFDIPLPVLPNSLQGKNGSCCCSSSA